MPTETNRASVRAINGEPCTFEVRSTSQPSQWHRVDLAAFNGAGQCACIRWDTVCWPIIRDTKNLPPSKRCRHLRAAREKCLNLLIADFNRHHPSE